MGRLALLLLAASRASAAAADEPGADALPGLPFLIVTTQRSGSTWLASMLDLHPRVRCARELLIRYDPDHLRARNATLGEVGAGEWFAALDGAFRELAPAAAGGGAPVYGFKLMLNEIAPAAAPRLAGWLAARGAARVVSLVREATVLKLVSAAQSPHFSPRTTNASEAARVARATPALALDARALATWPARVRRIEARERRWRAAFARDARLAHLEVTYEQLAASRERADRGVRSVLEFIGADTPRARAAEAARGAGGAAEPRDYARDARALRRMHAESCAARIRDWREIRHRFAGTTAYRACGLLDALAKHRPDEGAANPD